MEQAEQKEVHTLRPEEITEEQVAKVAEDFDSNDNVPEVYKQEPFRSEIIELDLAGDWLREKLGDTSLSEGTINKVCFALGQCVAQNGKVWEQTYEALEKAKEGLILDSGISLATALIYNTDLPYVKIENN